MSVNQNKPRKSSRLPVPNPLYQQGISQLKNENPIRSKRRQRNNEQELASYQDERNSQLNYDQSFNHNDSKDQYLTYRLPDGSQKKVKFIVQAKKEQKKKEKQPVYIPVKPPPPPTNNKKTPNLLNLFIQAFDNVDAQQEGSQQDNSVKTPQIPIQKQKIIPMKPKRSKIDQQDYIKKLTVQNKKMKIIHSQLQQVEIPLQWQPQQPMIQEQNNQHQLQVDEIKKKLQNCKAIKNISILMT